MKNHSNDIDKIVGLGAYSLRKNYFPELKTKIKELQEEIEIRKKAEENFKKSNEWLTDLIENTEDVVWSCNETGSFTYISPRCLAIFGKTSEELYDSSIFDLVSEKDLDFFKKVFKKNERITIRLAAKNFAGKKVIIERSLVPITPNQLKGYRGIDRDISLRIEQEEEIKKLNRTLEKKVEQRTEQLNKSLTELKSAQQKIIHSEKMASLGVLVAGVSHEINTPIGIAFSLASFTSEKIKSMLNLFKEQKLTAEEFDSSIKSILESNNLIVSNLNRASNLINSFKKIAVDRSNLEERIINLHNYTNEILLSLSGQLKTKSCTVENLINENLEINSCAGAFAQVITNLIINSVKHGFEKKLNTNKIKISSYENFETVKIEIEDNGKGIKKGIINKIFDPFFTTKRQQGGSGLGLSISYNLVSSKLKGELQVESEVGKFTKFTILLKK